MQYSSALLEALITELTRLPGLGRKSAQRIAFHILRASEGTPTASPARSST